MKELNILKKNKVFANYHRGKRCFIIGSGPSLKEQNLLLLKNELNIAVNNLFHHENIQEISPKYWICADPYYFNLHKGEVLPVINAIEKKGIITNLFLPYSNYGKIYIQSANFYNIHYFNYDFSKTIDDNIDFTQGILPYGQNSICVALMLALYLGCNPIHLIGCDHTWWGWNQEEYKNNHIPYFTGGVSEREMSLDYSFDLIKSTIYVQKYQYLQLKKYAEKRGFDIYNSTNGGYLDVFKRSKYEQLKFHMKEKDSQQLLSKLDDSSFILAKSAIQLINNKDFISALVLIEEAIRQNINKKMYVKGLSQIREICYKHINY